MSAPAKLIRIGEHWINVNDISHVQFQHRDIADSTECVVHFKGGRFITLEDDECGEFYKKLNEIIALPH